MGAGFRGSPPPPSERGPDLAVASRDPTGDPFGGQLPQGRDDEVGRARKAGIEDLDTKYGRDDMCKSDVIFAATGVTNGTMLDGVKWEPGFVNTHTVVMRSKTGTVRYIRARSKR